MKRFIVILLTAQFMFIISHELFSQSITVMQEFGISTGAFTNFPANQNYLKEGTHAFYVAPYLRVGKHEFFAGIVYPLKNHGVYFSDENINPRPGAIAGYKFYVFNVFGRENMFVHYSFEYLRFNGDVYSNLMGSNLQALYNETDMYINNVIGLGYNLFFDMNERFALYYTLDYVISQAGYKRGTPGSSGNAWITRYIWNNLSTNFGFSFKLTSLKKNEKK